MTNTITITDAAAEHIKQMIAKDNANIGFRLSIKKTGCSGYAYVPAIIDKVNESDIHFVTSHLNIYIDPAAESLLKNIVIDYVNDAVGLKQKRLVFINPNEKARCGCGESFTVE
jgi:iron-sulfur cluster assembly protein